MKFVSDRQRKYLMSRFNRFAKSEDSIMSVEQVQRRNEYIPIEEIERVGQKAREEVKWDIAGNTDINSIPVVLAPFGEPAKVASSLQTLTPVGNWFYNSNEIAQGYNRPYKQLLKKYEPIKRAAISQNEELIQAATAAQNARKNAANAQEEMYKQATKTAVNTEEMRKEALNNLRNEYLKNKRRMRRQADANKPKNNDPSVRVSL